jgi:predicted DNA-binding transcriptional regulator AlpA
VKEDVSRAFCIQHTFEGKKVLSDHTDAGGPVSANVGGVSLAEVRALPVVVDLPTAARVIGVGRTKAYDLVRLGQFPVRVIAYGKSYRVTRADLLSFLGITDREPV